MLQVVKPLDCLVHRLSTQESFTKLACFYQNVQVLIIVFRAARRSLGEIVSACEFMDGQCMRAVNDNCDLASPLDQDYPFYFLVSLNLGSPLLTRQGLGVLQALSL